MNAKRLAKKFAAISMVAAMVFTAPAAAFAADDGSVTSSGTNNGHLSGKKTLVCLPTISEEDVSFVVDPERLINATSDGTAGFSAALATDGATGIISANSAGIYFPAAKRDDGALSGSSAFVARNIGTEDVKLEIKATPTSGTMVLTDSAVDTITTGPASLYLAINSTHSGSVAGIEGADNGVSVITGATTVSIPISGASANYVATSSGAGYKMAMKSEVAARAITDEASGWDTATFSLEGYCQPGSAKSGNDNLTVPSIGIVWNIKTMDGAAPKNEDDTPYKADENGNVEEVEEADAEPTVNGKTASDTKQTIHYTSGQALVIPASIGSGALAAASLDRITYVNSSNVSTKLAAENWSYANGNITIAESYITALANNNVTRDYKVTFVDSEGVTYKQVAITLAP